MMKALSKKRSTGEGSVPCYEKLCVITPERKIPVKQKDLGLVAIP